jgi:hypothetical protein
MVGKFEREIAINYPFRLNTVLTYSIRVRDLKDLGLQGATAALVAGTGAQYPDWILA